MIPTFKPSFKVSISEFMALNFLVRKIINTTSKTKQNKNENR